MKSLFVWVALCFMMLLTTSVVLAEPQRIQFKTGATSAQVSGLIRGYELKEYRFRAEAGQQLKLSVDSKRSNWLLIGIVGPGSQEADVYSNYINGTTEFNGTLPKSGDYVLRLGIIRAEARREGVVDYAATIKILPNVLGSRTELVGRGQYRVQGQEPSKIEAVKLEFALKGNLKMSVSLGEDGFVLDGTWSDRPDGAILLTIQRFAGVGDVQGSGLVVLDKSGRPSYINLYFYYPEQKTLHALSFQVK